MSEEKIGSLRRVPLNEVWPHEAHDFTPWLAEKIDVLNNAIDLSLSIVEREHPAGDFSVDLVAEDESGNPVVIENQYKRSNHDHLGKLITYLTAIGAKAAIWIVEDPRPEHISAISWLNESSSASFYLLKLEAVRIENSLPAPLLTLIVGSSDESQEVGETKREFTERHSLRRRFWTQLLDRAKEQTLIHANVSPSQRSEMWARVKSGLSLRYVIRQHDAGVELYIDRGTDADNENKQIFDTLANAQGEIEAAFGEPIEWQRLEGQRSCRIGKQLSLGGYRDDEEKWQEVQEAMIDAMIRLEAALRPHIDKLPA
ncbi:DUF4268 domain-containing protein [Candidatus Poribacteria bacterium]|nr:MAG: DUF4268 domain-containing protein [Candidatus Poribacteria bacterium]